MKLSGCVTVWQRDSLTQLMAKPAIWHEVALDLFSEHVSVAKVEKPEVVFVHAVKTCGGSEVILPLVVNLGER